MIGNTGWTYLKYRSRRCCWTSGEGSRGTKSSSPCKFEESEGKGGHTRALGNRLQEKQRSQYLAPKIQGRNSNKPNTSLIPSIDSLLVSEKIQAASFAVIPDLLLLVQTKFADRPGKSRLLVTLVRCRLTSIRARASTQNTSCIPSTALTDGAPQRPGVPYTASS